MKKIINLEEYKQNKIKKQLMKDLRKDFNLIDKSDGEIVNSLMDGYRVWFSNLSEEKKRELIKFSREQ